MLPRHQTNSSKEDVRKVASSTVASWNKSASTFRANPPSPFTLSNVQTAHELLKGKWTARANVKVVQTNEKGTSSCKRKKSLQHEVSSTLPQPYQFSYSRQSSTRSTVRLQKLCSVVASVRFGGKCSALDRLCSTLVLVHYG